MPIVSITIPQIGEGLQEARVVAFLKQPGDRITRDEPIYQMETDKAVMDVESPVDGVLVSWSGNVDDVLAIGAEIAKVESSEVGASVEAAPSAANTGTAPLYVPQIGEGLQEARIVAFLKQPGETVKRDDPIYQMETDKAVMDVESPYDGTLVSWSAKVDDVVAIGAEVGVMAVAGDTEVAAAPSHGSAPTTTAAPAQSQSSGAQSTGLQGIPPRTRAYAKEKNISDDVLLSIRFSGSKLMPADIDAYLAGSGSNAAKLGYSEKALSSKQRVLNSRMVRSNALVIPGTMTVVASWKPIENERQRNKDTGDSFQPSAFTMFSYAVVKAMQEFPAFRSALEGDDKVKTYDHVSLGIAVSLPGDELVLAVVDNADDYTWESFAAKMRENIEIARGGKDQAHAGVTVSLTNMQAFGLRNAVPVVVAPSMATIFLGEVFHDLDETGSVKRVVNITMTFDHRLANGVGAAEFLNKIKTNVEAIGSILI